MSADVAQLNFVVRALIRVMYGTALQPGSHAEAAAAYRRAAQLNPQRLVHHVELGRVLMRLGQPARAKNHLLAAMGLDIEDINAHLTRLEGELMLASLQQHEPQPSSDEDEEAAPHDSPASGNSAAAA
jgi:predicted Zn-dependent protease